MLTLQQFMITVLSLNALQFNEQRKTETGEPVQGDTEKQTSVSGRAQDRIMDRKSNSILFPFPRCLTEVYS